MLMKSNFLWLTVLTLSLLLCSQTSPPPEAKQDAEAVALLKKARYWLDDVYDLDSAAWYAQRSAARADAAGDWYTWGDAQTTELEIDYYSGKYGAATAKLDALEQKAQNLLAPDSSFWGDFYNIGGALFYQLGNYEKALAFGHKEIAHAEKSGSTESATIASNNIGSYYRSRGDFDRALEYTQSALQKLQSNPKADPGDLSWTYGNLSAILYRKKDFPRSLDYAERALSILEKHFPNDRWPDYIVVYNDLANAYTELLEYEKALDYLHKALRLAEREGIQEQLDVTLHNLGHVYRMMGRYPEAQRYLTKAIGQYGPKHPNYGKACRHMGYIAQHKGDLYEALRWQQKALLALTDTFDYQNILANPSPQRVNAYLDLLFALRDKGETLQLLSDKENDQAYLEAALATYDLAAGLLDSMRVEYQEGSRQFWNQEARPIMESAAGTALRRYEKTGQSRYLEQAFRFAERSKALLLAEALQESAAKDQAGVPDSLLQAEKQLKIDIAFYKKQIFREQQRSAPDQDKILLWQSETLSRRRAYEQLLAKLETTYPEYYRIKYEQPDTRFATLQQQLPEHGALIEYFLGEREGYVFYLDRKSAHGFSFSPDSAFMASLDGLLSDLRDRDRVQEQGRSAATIARFTERASTLFDTLLGPVRDRLPAQIIIIPDGPLAYLPFELLLTKATGPEAPRTFSALPYLLRTATVRYEYSAALTLQPTPRRNTSRFFTGFAPSYGGDWAAASIRGEADRCREADPADFAPLHNNQTEVTHIAELTGGKSYLGDQATEQAFREQQQTSRILHLAMHGFLNDCDPLYSGLVFTNQSMHAETDSSAAAADGFLHAYEIYNLRMHADLAVLSACNTGHGKLAKGEGVISLARAFKYAGCANVLMSLWQADDQATARIMEQFYHYLSQGMGKDAAIRQAKLDFLDSNSRNHPFFWGAFVLIGDDQPLLPERDGKLYWYALAGLLALGGGWAIWRSRRPVQKNR